MDKNEMDMRRQPEGSPTALKIRHEGRTLKKICY